MRRMILIAMILIAIPGAIWAQGLRDKKDDVVVNNQPIRKKVTKKAVELDTVLSSHYLKQHGWFRPADTITAEYASHLPTYYRFTKKNREGHWTRLETLTGYGQYSTGIFSPYILKIRNAETDSRANAEWVSRVGTTCIYEAISDWSGRNVVQERAYDKDMNIIYTFSVVPIGNNQYVGSYKDSYGMPVEMRQEPDYTYGTLIKMTRDRWGNDSVLQYIDAKGKIKLNSDSVAMERFIWDSRGRLLKQMSCNADGSLAIDNWGNCGVEFKYNGYNIIEQTYCDENWQPMTLPSTVRDVTGKAGISKIKYEYDDYGRCIREEYYDVNGQSAETLLGLHAIDYAYTDHGYQTLSAGFDLNGKPAPIYVKGISKICVDVDDQGRSTDIIFLDINGQPFELPGYLSRKHFEYDEQGRNILLQEFSMENGKEYLSYQCIDKPQYFEVESHGEKRIDSLDHKGRLIYRGFFDANNNLRKDFGRAYEIDHFQDFPKRTIQTYSRYDEHGNLCNDNDGECRGEVHIDSIAWTNKAWVYDKDGRLLKIVLNVFEPDFKTLLASYDMNRLGVITRSGVPHDVRYYRGDALRNYKGAYISLYGRDEFDEADYVYCETGPYYYKKVFPNSKEKFYDEYNQIIWNTKQESNVLPKAISIEVIDSVAYQKGLRDNDIVILYGDYVANFDSNISYDDFRGDWTLRTVLDAQEPKRMVVFRIEDAEADKYGLVEIPDLAGTPSQLGFIPHSRFLTGRQTNRITKSIIKNIMSANPLLKIEDMTPKRDNANNPIKFIFNEMYWDQRQKPYPSQITDPSILLGECVPDLKLTYRGDIPEEDANLISIVDMNGKPADRLPRTHYFFTKDGENVVTLSSDQGSVGMMIIERKVSDKDLERLKALYEKTSKDMTALCKEKPKYPVKSLIGAWEMEYQGDFEYPMKAYVELNKDMTYQASILIYATLDVVDVTAIVAITSKVSGQWSLGGELLHLSPFAEDISLQCVKTRGLDAQYEKRRIDFLNSEFQKYTSDYLKVIEIISEQLPENLFLDNVMKDSFQANSKYDFKKATGSMTQFVQTFVADNEETSTTYEASTPIPQDSPFIGNWILESSGDAEYMRVNMGLLADGEYHMVFYCETPYTFDNGSQIKLQITVDIHEAWECKPDLIRLDFNPENMNVNFTYSVDEDLDPTLKAGLDDIFETSMKPYNSAFGVSIIDGFDMFYDWKKAKVEDGQLLLNGFTFTRDATTSIP